MTNAAQSVSGGFGPSDSPAVDPSAGDVTTPAGWRDLRGNDDIQFEPIEITPEPPPEPSWFDQILRDFFLFLADILAPVGMMIGAAWPWLQWVLVGLVAAFVLYLAVRTFGPLARQRSEKREAMSEPEWAPSEEESVALLDDADQLAAQGRFDEATHLLLQRSVSHISAARPEWVEPSSTARELAALPALSQAARGAFATISERVERSLFALRALDRSDWETARAAYADFALAKLDGNGTGINEQTNEVSA